MKQKISILLFTLICFLFIGCHTPHQTPSSQNYDTIDGTDGHVLPEFPEPIPITISYQEADGGRYKWQYGDTILRVRLHSTHKHWDLDETKKYRFRGIPLAHNYGVLDIWVCSSIKEIVE